MEDPRISRMYASMAKQRFAKLFQRIWRKGVMRSGMVTGLILAAAALGLGIAYREHMQGRFHLLKGKIASQHYDAPVPRPGGQEALTLTRTQLAGAAAPEFLSVTMLPGRGMNVLQIAAYIPSRGNVDLMASPPVEAAETAMTGKGDDANGHASLEMGGAFEAPWAGGIWGAPLQPGGRVSAVWRGRAMALPATAKEGVAAARDGLLLAEPAASTSTTALPDGGQAEAVYHCADFGGRWPSSTDLTISVLLSSRSIELTVTARNAGKTAEPIGIGWRPRFAVLSGDRGQLRLSIPGALREEVRDRANGLPSGQLVPVAGTVYDFAKRGGVALGTAGLDDGFVELHQELLENGPVAELIDPIGNYGLRITALSSAIKAIRVVAPADADFVSIAPQYNYDDPFGREWAKDTDTGMAVLEPGQTTQWKVRLEIFSPPANTPPR